MASHADPDANAAMPVRETPSHRNRRTAHSACSSPHRPCGLVFPARRARALWRLTQWNDIGLRLRKALPDNLNLRLHTVEDRRVFTENLSSRQAQLQFGAVVGAWILRKKKKARLRALCRKPISMPGRKLNTGNVLWRDASHIQHNGAEATRLSQQVRTSHTLLNGVVWFGSFRRPHHLRDRRQTGLRALLLWPLPMLRFGAARG